MRRGSAGTVLAIALHLACGSACGDTASAPAADAGAPPLGLSPEQAGRVLARVGDTTITLGDYAATLERMDPFDRLRYQTLEKRRELLKEMIDIELLAIEARKRGLDKQPAAQEAERQVLRDALLSELHKTLPTPTQIPMDEVRAYYDAHVDEYREPERRRVSAIVLGDEEKANEILAEAARAPDATAWGKLYFSSSIGAKEGSQKDVPLDLAGDLGIVGPPADPKGASARVPEPVRAAVFRLAKVGEVLGEVVPDPTSTPPRFYVIRLSGMTQAHDRSLAEAERQIRVTLLKQKMVEQEVALEVELRKKFKVEIDDEALARVGSPTPAASASATP